MKNISISDQTKEETIELNVLIGKHISNSDEAKKKIIQPSVLFGCSQISLVGSAMELAKVKFVDAGS